jgi:Flp pilus assembly protein TadB
VNLVALVSPEHLSRTFGITLIALIICALAFRATLRETARDQQRRRLSLQRSPGDAKKLRAQSLVHFGREPIDADLIEALTTIGRAVRSGTALSMAILQVGDALPQRSVGQGFLQVQHEASQIGLLNALRAWGSRDQRCERTAWALAIAVQTGGDSTAAVDALVSSLRAGQSLQRELGALTAQSTLSAAVLALVPVMFAGLLSGTDPRAREFLFSSTIGRGCLVLGLLMNLLAWRWLRRIADVAT